MSRRLIAVMANPETMVITLTWLQDVIEPLQLQTCSGETYSISVPGLYRYTEELSSYDVERTYTYWRQLMWDQNGVVAA